MPRPLLIFSQSYYLIQIVVINSHTQWQTVQIQISWLLQKPTDLGLHCLPRQSKLCAAREGLKSFILVNNLKKKKSNSAEIGRVGKLKIGFQQVLLFQIF